MDNIRIEKVRELVERYPDILPTSPVWLNDKLSGRGRVDTAHRRLIAGRQVVGPGGNNLPYDELRLNETQRMFRVLTPEGSALYEKYLSRPEEFSDEQLQTLGVQWVISVMDWLGELGVVNPKELLK